MKTSHCIETEDGISFGFDAEDLVIGLPGYVHRTITWSEWDQIVEFINSHR